MGPRWRTIEWYAISRVRNIESRLYNFSFENSFTSLLLFHRQREFLLGKQAIFLKNNFVILVQQIETYLMLKEIFVFFKHNAITNFAAFSLIIGQNEFTKVTGVQFISFVVVFTPIKTIKHVT
jgi:hypothetical protein